MREATTIPMFLNTCVVSKVTHMLFDGGGVMATASDTTVLNINAQDKLSHYFASVHGIAAPSTPHKSSAALSV